MSAADMAADTSAEMTDGFHLVVDALKLNGVDTIFGVAGIPITDPAAVWVGILTHGSPIPNRAFADPSERSYGLRSINT